MKKPTIKKEVAVVDAFLFTRRISFYSSRDALGDFQEFGEITEFDNVANKYILIVDSRFDFNEVLEYMQTYG